MATSAPPPPYDPNATRDPSQPAPATNIPNQPGSPIPMQPVAQQPGAQAGMATSGQKVTPLHMLSESPDWIDCPMCHTRARTRVQTEGEGMQFLTGAILCLVCICLAPLPCCLHWFEQTNWFCTNCNKQVATKTPDNPIHVLAVPNVVVMPSQYPQGVPPAHVNPQAYPAGSPPPQGDPQQQQSWLQGQPQSPPPQQYQQQQQQYVESPGSHPEISYAPTQQYAPGAPESQPVKH